ncbi:hypothetical protein LguiB_031862 [Lonicera macranthoides]
MQKTVSVPSLFFSFSSSFLFHLSGSYLREEPPSEYHDRNHLLAHNARSFHSGL